MAAFTVYCNMIDKNGVGVTVISHDSESRTKVRDGLGWGGVVAATDVTFITQERVCLSWPVSPVSPHTVSSLSSMSVITR